MTSWSRIARRIRVPLGFVFAALYIWLAHPTWTSISAGGVIAACGVLLRALASGHVKKNAELTMTGPYSWTRNPLYVGSMIIGAGFAVASLNWWVVVGLLILLLAIYIPVVRSEEAYLREHFAGFDTYVAHVPRFVGIRSLRPLFAGNHGNTQGGQFSRVLYMKHREYNAAIGTLSMLAALAAKLLFVRP